MPIELYKELEEARGLGNVIKNMDAMADIGIDFYETSWIYNGPGNCCQKQGCQKEILGENFYLKNYFCHSLPPDFDLVQNTYNK